MTNLVTKKWQIGPIDVPADAEMTPHKGRYYPLALSEERRRIQDECHAVMNEHIDSSPRGDFTHKWILEEFLLNALSHGNNLDPSKRVEVRLIVNEVREEGIRRVLAELHVLDEGEHFTLGGVPDPTAPENIERPTGRGLAGTLGLLERRYEGGGIFIDHEKPEGAETGKRVIVSWKRKEAIPSDAQ